MSTFSLIPAHSAHRLIAPALGLLLLAAAPARAAESYTLKDLSVDDGQMHLEAPELVVKGGGLGRAELEALVKAGKPGEVLDKLIAGGADSLAAPLLTLELRRADPGNAGGTRQRLALSGLEVKGLKGGTAATLSAEGLTARLDKGGEVKTGPLKVTQAGLGALARLAQGRPWADAPLAGEARLEAIAITRPAGATSMAALTLKGLAARGGAALLPLVGEVEASGLKGSRADTPGGPRQAWSMAGFKLAAEDGKAGAPARFSASAGGLAVEEGGRDLAELGYAPLRLGAALEGVFDAGGQELLIERLQVTGEDFGSITFAARLGNVAGLKPAGPGAPGPLAQARVKWMSVVVENAGLFDRLVARRAKAGAIAPAQARSRMTAEAQMIAMMMLGDQARSPLGEAVNRFLAAPGRLSVRSQARDADGVPVSDLSRKPGAEPAIAGRFTVTAEVR